MDCKLSNTLDEYEVRDKDINFSHDHQSKLANIQGISNNIDSYLGNEQQRSNDDENISRRKRRGTRQRK